MTTASNIPEHIVDNIILLAMQLRNLPVCQEIKQITNLINTSINFFGRTFGRLPNQLSITHELLLGAPDDSDYLSEDQFEQVYTVWRQTYTNSFWSSWPNSSIKFLINP